VSCVYPWLPLAYCAFAPALLVLYSPRPAAFAHFLVQLTLPGLKITARTASGGNTIDITITPIPTATSPTNKAGNATSRLHNGQSAIVCLFTLTPHPLAAPRPASRRSTGMIPAACIEAVDTSPTNALASRPQRHHARSHRRVCPLVCRVFRTLSRVLSVNHTVW